MIVDNKNVFDNIPFLFQDSKFLLDDMETVLDKLEEWGFEDYYNVFSSINLFFSIKNEKYIFYIDNKSIFFKEKSIYEYTFGELFISTANVLRKGLSILPPRTQGFSTFIYTPALKPIFDKYKDYINRYAKPSVEFLIEFYYDLLSFGFFEVIAILIIRDFLVWQSKPDILENYDPKKAKSIKHGLMHCMDSITSQDFFLYDEKFFDVNEPYKSAFSTAIMPLDGTPTILYINVSLNNLYIFDRYNIFSKQYTVKICGCCKCFFIQKKDYDTKYCNACKNISYEKKVTDPFLKLYRKKYKTMKMRAFRAENQVDYEDKYTIPWEDNIKSVINEYRENNDLIGFETYLKETMKKYKP